MDFFKWMLKFYLIMKNSANHVRFVSAWQWFYDNLFTMRMSEVLSESLRKRQALFTLSHHTLFINVTNIQVIFNRLSVDRYW